MRYSWSKPNPFFLPALAGARPLFIYAPAHYLKQFHERYAEPAELARLVEADRARDWAQLHGRRDDMYRFDNPDLPTLAALGAADTRRRRSASSPSATPTTTGSTPPASSCPTSTG